VQAIRLALLAALLTLPLAATAAGAANPPAAPPAGAGAPAKTAPNGASTTVPDTDVDAEEALDESLKRFGYLTGLARGCVVDEQRPKLEREALELATVIARLFGTDRAFLYSSSFGYGTAMKTAIEDCAEVVKQYDQRVERFRAGRGEQR
jgi:hypothetical protein